MEQLTTMQLSDSSYQVWMSKQDGRADVCFVRTGQRSKGTFAAIQVFGSRQCVHRRGSQPEVCEQAGSPAGNNLIDPRTPSVCLIEWLERVQPGELVESDRPARSNQLQERGVNRGGVAKPGSNRRRLPGLRLRQNSVQRSAGRWI